MVRASLNTNGQPRHPHWRHQNSTAPRRTSRSTWRDTRAGNTGDMLAVGRIAALPGSPPPSPTQSPGAEATSAAANEYHSPARFSLPTSRGGGQRGRSEPDCAASADRREICTAWGPFGGHDSDRWRSCALRVTVDRPRNASEGYDRRRSVKLGQYLPLQDPALPWSL